MNLQSVLRHQAQACADLGSPFTARLLRLVAERLQPGTAIADRLLTWPGDIGPSAQSVPLRLAGSLHGLVLSGTAPNLAAAYPPHGVDDDTLWAAIVQSLQDHETTLQTWLNSPPQTNEVRRSACLIAIGHWLGDRHGLPLILTEIGASAGLNLMWDHYALSLPDQLRGPTDAALTLTPDWQGDLPPNATVDIAERRGVDLNPLNPHAPEDALRLQAYIWPDQMDRMARTRAAIGVAQVPVDAADAIAWLPQRLETPRPGHLHLIYSTIAWQYLPDAARAKGDTLIAAAGARATADAPLARFAMEADGQSPGAGMTVQLWPGGAVHDMGRIDYHGRWIDWRNGGPS